MDNLPSGISLSYEILKDNPVVSFDYKVSVKFVLSPSQGYIIERYNHYYSQDFENILINKHMKEIDIMLEKYNSNCYVNSAGVYEYDQFDGECSYCKVSFSDLGLKPLNSISQIYTLFKVLTDRLSISDKKNYFVEAYPVSKKEGYDTWITSLMFHIKERPTIQPKPELNDW